MSGRRLSFALLLASLALPPGHAAEAVAPSLHVPVAFEALGSKAGRAEQFVARGGGYTAYLGPNHVRILFSSAGAHGREVRLKWPGGNPKARGEVVDRLKGRAHYYTGRDPASWRTDVALYRRVRYRSVYPGIDLVFYGRAGLLEYDWELAPGADPRRIRFQADSGGRLRLDGNGDLLIEDGPVLFRQRKPSVFQPSGTGGVERDGRYVLNEGVARVEIRDWDPTKPTVIDPVLSYATYLGGELADAGWSVALDSAGNAYVAGSTASSAFPATVDPQPLTRRWLLDAFVLKLNSKGTQIEYAAYLGGRMNDEASGIAVDPAGRAILTGSTQSTDFPRTANAAQSTMGGGPLDAFVTVLSPSGSQLVYSSHLGGENEDAGCAVTAGQGSDVYVAGHTYSRSVSASAAPHVFGPGGAGDAFLLKLKTDGRGLEYAVQLGGKSFESACAVKVDGACAAYVVGDTRSADFPITEGSAQTRYGQQQDAFVAKVHPTGTSLVYAAYLGGERLDSGFGMAVDAAGQAYVTGCTSSPGFPRTPGAAQAELRGEMDAFVSKLAPDGRSLLYSTFWGGSGSECGFAIAVDRFGKAHFTGGTNSADLPVTRDAASKALRGPADAFLAVLDPAGSSSVHVSYFGGGSLDRGLGIALDSRGGVTLVGDTSSPDMAATAGVPQAAYRGGEWDAWAMTLQPPPLSAVSAARFTPSLPLAPGSLAAAYGTELARETLQATSLPLPVSLGGRELFVTDSGGVTRSAPLVFVSPGQVNFQVPAGTREGQVSLDLIGESRFLAVGQALIEAVAPALFSMNGDGRGVAAAIAMRVAAGGAVTTQAAFRCGTAPASCVPAVVELGDPDDQVFLLLFGTGIRGRSGVAAVTASIGGVPAEVLYAGPQSEYPGLDQVNLRIPRSLAGRGEVAVGLTVDGRPANTVSVAFR